MTRSFRFPASTHFPACLQNPPKPNHCHPYAFCARNPFPCHTSKTSLLQPLCLPHFRKNRGFPSLSPIPSTRDTVPPMNRLLLRFVCLAHALCVGFVLCGTFATQTVAQQPPQKELLLWQKLEADIHE